MMPPRQRAAALLDVLRYREDGDRTLAHRRRAERYRKPPRDLVALAWAWAWADNLEQDDARTPLMLARKWWPLDAARPTMSMLVFAGAYGVGKTVAAAWMLAHHPRFAAATYLRAPQVAELELARPLALARLAGANVLVLDELGHEGELGPTLTRMSELLALRFEGRRPTLVTCNLKLEQFGDRYGRKLVDRMREDGIFRVFDTPSLRAPTRRPELAGIERSCRIADLTAAVDAATSGAGHHVAAIEQLRETFDVSEHALEQVLARRARWQNTHG